MQVDHAVKAFILVLDGRPVLHGTEIITQVQFTRRLYTGKDSFLFHDKEIEDFTKQATKLKNVREKRTEEV